MTYCVAMSLEAGMVFASDSRTNAGVDQISRFSKMRTFVRNGERVIVSLASGNLSITQNAVNILEQTGEIKYRKPIIDRVITRDTSLTEATKCTLVSFDSTMRSNISVGLPIDLLTYETDALTVRSRRRIDESDPYFSMIHRQWGEGLRKVFGELPNPDW
jgi:putative proteasome-type protease